MNFISDYLKKLKKKRIAQKVEEKKLNMLFDAFVDETRPLVPKAKKYPQAALYRLCWKRAIVLSDIYSESNDEKEKSIYIIIFVN